MRILLIGSGGREHALAWKLSRSPSCEKLYIAPGNGGTAALGENVAIPDDDIRGLIRFAMKHDIDLVVAGPEKPLTMGLANALADEGIPCFGPTEHAAQLEGSKAFAKRIMLETGIPTAHFAVFDDYHQALEFVNERGAPLVVKADGLAAGKGVVVCETVERARMALDEIMRHKTFGLSGERVVIEELLVGEEVSFLAFCDGKTCVAMPPCQDHKPVGEGDTGPNTGGMGAFCPARILPESLCAEALEKFIRPVVDHMASIGQPFKGVLYAGLILTDSGPMVLEYNVRFGDPECQPLMRKFDGDLAKLMHGCATGRLDPSLVRWKDGTALCVVMAAKGYPGDYPKGMAISGIDAAEEVAGVSVFQAGTKKTEAGLVTSGGRVLGVTALGEDLADARERAYKAVDLIDFENAYVRRDIGAKGFKWEGK